MPPVVSKIVTIKYHSEIMIIGHYAASIIVYASNVKTIWWESLIQPQLAILIYQIVGLSVRVRTWLLFCVSIRGSVASANWFSSRVVRCLLLLSSVSIGHTLAFTFTC